MELDELKTFVQIVERGSLSAAARATRQSLPTTSRHLQALEADLGAPLALRTTRKLVVTDAGRRLYEHARRALFELERARTGASQNERVVVSTGVTIGQHLVLPRIVDLLARRPELRLELRLEDRVTELLTENVDVVVRAGVDVPDHAELVAHALLTFPRTLVAAPAYLDAQGRPKTPAALGGHACLVQVTSGGPVDRWRLGRSGRDRTVEVQARFASTAPHVLLGAACAGLGIAFLPPWLTAEAIAQGRLERVLPGWESSPITMYAVHRRSRRGSPAVRAFIEAMTTAHAR